MTNFARKTPALSRGIRTKLSTLAGAALASVLILSTAQAGETISVGADKVHIMKFDTTPATVIVGNPLFADVSVDPRKKLLIIQGRNYGRTNMVLLDKMGNQLREFDVQVTNVAEPEKVSVYSAGKRASYSCAPQCVATLDVGDSPEALAQAAAIMSAKENAINGSSSAAVSNDAGAQPAR